MRHDSSHCGGSLSGGAAALGSSAWPGGGMARGEAGFMAGCAGGHFVDMPCGGAGSGLCRGDERECEFFLL